MFLSKPEEHSMIRPVEKQEQGEALLPMIAATVVRVESSCKMRDDSGNGDCGFGVISRPCVTTLASFACLIYPPCLHLIQMLWYLKAFAC
jgi:hypothetical protein